MDSEEERLPDEKYVEDLAKKLPQGTDKTPEVLEEALKGLPDKYVPVPLIIHIFGTFVKNKLIHFSYRWKNYIIRGIFTLIMILGFCLIIYGGPLALMITVNEKLISLENSFKCLIVSRLLWCK